jgi:ankyrin repeat protein
MRSIRSVLFVLAIVCTHATPSVAQNAQSALWEAAIAGDTSAIRKAVTEGARVDSLDTRTSRNGRHALNWAAWFNRVDAARLLIELKAPLEAVNYTGFTALHHAAENGSIDVARLLLAAGADPDHGNSEGKKPAETARERGHNAIAELIDKSSRKVK